MLRTGLWLLSSSSLGVLYRHVDLAYSTHSALKWVCLTGLATSLACFVLTYLRFQHPMRLNAFPRRPDMIKSPAWKPSSIA